MVFRTALFRRERICCGLHTLKLPYQHRTNVDEVSLDYPRDFVSRSMGTRKLKKGLIV